MSQFGRGYNTDMNFEYGGCSECGHGDAAQSGGKRKLSEYNIFMRKELKALKKQHPDKTAPQLMKIAAQKWRESGKHNQARKAKAVKPKAARKPKAAKKNSILSWLS